MKYLLIALTLISFAASANSFVCNTEHTQWVVTNKTMIAIDKETGEVFMNVEGEQFNDAFYYMNPSTSGLADIYYSISIEKVDTVGIHGSKVIGTRTKYCKGQ
ncbi:hypothetical protein J8L86_17590 [Shewanella sp. MMG014]|uniref:hypothetical protein n=1 Tax=Shewanella sp. MMG014 TaxID=2822691 RepID=UPI001B3872E6|nr:hypothetical protein [Shewanella sp. MMG014]MBQ4891664.1 hypothetical protein [Shewanella sp. MMG014]